MTPTVTLRATYWSDWWPPDDDPDVISWGGFCDPENPWGTADDDEPADPTCALCGETLYWRHAYSNGYKVDGATGWLNWQPEWSDEPEPDECEHRPEWAEITDDTEPIELVLPIYQAAEFIEAFEGGVWDLWESEHHQNYRNGVSTAVTLHVGGDGAEAAVEIATQLRELLREGLDHA